MNIKNSALVLFCLSAGTDAFTPTRSPSSSVLRHHRTTALSGFLPQTLRHHHRQGQHGVFSTHHPSTSRTMASVASTSSAAGGLNRLWASLESSGGDSGEGGNGGGSGGGSSWISKNDEAERLRLMASKLRAEAAALEAQQAQEVADATERAFRKFDMNQDGEISVKELKEGLEKVLKTELDESRVERLMEEFDLSGDGALQLNEFVGIDRFRLKLDSIVREEKTAARAAKAAAIVEEEAARLAEARLELINDRPPTTTDRIVSIVPYLLPLLDGLQFGAFFLASQTDNPIVGALVVLLVLYRNIPFSGLITFIALNILSGNLSLNRLIRFNMQQAIFLDISLFIPSLILGIIGLADKAVTGTDIPEAFIQGANGAVFVTLVAVIAYAIGSSLLGITPDKIPLISDRVTRQQPTVDMFDEEGRFIRPPPDDNDNNNDKKDGMSGRGWKK